MVGGCRRCPCREVCTALPPPPPPLPTKSSRQLRPPPTTAAATTTPPLLVLLLVFLLLLQQLLLLTTAATATTCALQTPLQRESISHVRTLLSQQKSKGTASATTIAVEVKRAFAIVAVLVIGIAKVRVSATNAMGPTNVTRTRSNGSKEVRKRTGSPTSTCGSRDNNNNSMKA